MPSSPRILSPSDLGRPKGIRIADYLRSYQIPLTTYHQPLNGVKAIMTNSNQSAITEVDTTKPTVTLELLGANGILGGAVAILTPAIKARRQELQPGQVLLLSLDDPLARLDVPAWCALTGNVLEATRVEEGGVTRFFIRKESKRR
jgi:TusA-related sulfurtransferase